MESDNDLFKCLFETSGPTETGIKKNSIIKENLIGLSKKQTNNNNKTVKASYF